MSDNTIDLKFKTTADTTGAKQTAEAIKQVKEAGKGTGGDAFSVYEKGAEKATQAAQKLSEALSSIMTAPAGDDPFAKAAQETAREIDILLQKQKELMSESKKSMDISGIDEATNKIKQLRQAYEQLINSGKSMKLDPDEEIQKIIAAHEKRTAAAEKAYDREEAAAAKALERETESEQKKLEASKNYAEKYEQNQARMKMSLQQLYAEQERYNNLLKQAQASGDAAGIKDSTENLKKLETQINATNRRIEVSDRRMARMVNRFRGMAGGAISAASALGGLSGQMGKVASMGSSVLQGAMFGGVWGAGFAAASKGIEMLINKLNEADEKQKEFFKSLSDKADEAARKAQESTHAVIIESIKTDAEGYLALVRKITEEYNKQTSELREQQDLERSQIDSRRALEDAEYGLNIATLENKKQKGTITQEEYELGRIDVERQYELRKLDREKEDRDLNLKNIQDQIPIEQEKYNKATAFIDAFSNKLPSVSGYGELLDKSDSEAKEIKSIVVSLTTLKDELIEAAKSSNRATGGRMGKWMEESLTKYIGLAEKGENRTVYESEIMNGLEGKIKNLAIESGESEKINELIDKSKKLGTHKNLYDQNSKQIKESNDKARSLGAPDTALASKEAYSEWYEGMKKSSEEAKVTAGEASKNIDKLSLSVDKLNESAQRFEEKQKTQNKSIRLAAETRALASKERTEERQKKADEAARKAEEKRIKEESEQILDTAQPFLGSANAEQSAAAREAWDQGKQKLRKGIEDGSLDASEISRAVSVLNASLQEHGITNQKAIGSLSAQLIKTAKQLDELTRYVGQKCKLK